ncbi:MAG TPA: hypothetical protein ENN69_03320 [Spirochaetia bacterium]|nr:hypothetical protein [Spirochaetia bacterium]
MAFNYVTQLNDRILIQNVIVSVYDKNSLEVIVEALIASNPEVVFYATGKTYEHLTRLLGDLAAGHVNTIASYTGQPEMQGGLVKTLDFKIYLGLLSETYNDAHQADLKRTGAIPFDMVIANLYPFREAIKDADSTPEHARGNIDIGGPCMIRAAAKNYHRVAVVTDRNDYRYLAEILSTAHGSLDLDTRYTLARKAFLLTAEYDTGIAEYFLNTGTEQIRRTYQLSKKGGTA